MRSIFAALFTLTIATNSIGQHLHNHKHHDHEDKFYQIDSWLPSPNVYRAADGAPGPEYWQQRADYDISVRLNDRDRRLDGTVRIDYHNRSPMSLGYIWVQLDQNRFSHLSAGRQSDTAPSLSGGMTFDQMRSLMTAESFDGGYKIKRVSNQTGDELPYIINDTMMRIDLAKSLKPGEITTFEIEYSYNIVNAKVMRARAGYEYFEEDDNAIYEIAQFYPRVAAYTDYVGWQNKRFLGRGEFTLEMGDFHVEITAPKSMVVAATGVLQNPEECLKPEWRERLEQAIDADKPIFIITPEEAKENESNRDNTKQTWVFEADRVRDFAFAASRKFIWDAMGVDPEIVPDDDAANDDESTSIDSPSDEPASGDSDRGPASKRTLCMSYYPNEAEPLWSQYSTEAIAHTIEVYGKYALTYPYPIAISVNGPVYGMEYPMICFNGPRPEEDKTYSRQTKYALISVIIHEVGHNFFPMIVNSDERQWTWMDEGLNTFLQYLAEREWEEDYPSRRGDPENMTGYMAGRNQRPIMTGSEEILQFGNNAYGKPATALNVLRETILGRELFDHAFRTFAQRWKFKRPTPSDFFRTMEDASVTDLDWFWRGWFYSTDHVDIAIDGVRMYRIDPGDPDEQAERKRRKKESREDTITDYRNRDIELRVDEREELRDFYNGPNFDELKVDKKDREKFQKLIDGLTESERALLRRTTNFYVVDFENVGGLVMPIIVRVHYSDSTQQTLKFPAEIWRSDSKKVSRLILTDKSVVRLELDPRRQLADTNESNNHWPPKLEPEYFELRKGEEKSNPMRDFQKRNEAGDKDEDQEDDKE